MDIGPVVGNIALFFIIAMEFYGLSFALRFITQSGRINKKDQLPVIVVFLLVSFMTGNLILLAVGIWAAAWTQTEYQKRKEK
jgi:uncharacterized integral membrane protein